MNDSNYVRTANASSLSTTFAKIMRKVYGYMAGNLVVTALAAMYVAKHEEWLYTIATNSALFWGLMIAEIGIVFYLSARIMKMSLPMAGLMMVLYSLLNGVTMSFIFMVYTSESIVNTFLVTAGTFAAMSVIGFFIKKDLSTIGRICYMALIGVIIASLVNYFVASSGLAMILNYVGVLVFVGLTAYDTQKIKRMAIAMSPNGITDETSKVALIGSLALYLDFINLFLYLLRFMGDRR